MKLMVRVCMGWLVNLCVSWMRVVMVVLFISVLGWLCFIFYLMYRFLV